jgi:hypothetical protein
MGLGMNSYPFSEQEHGTVEGSLNLYQYARAGVPRYAAPL